MANSGDSDETARLRAVSSGSALFEKVYMLVCREEMLKFGEKREKEFQYLE